MKIKRFRSLNENIGISEIDNFNLDNIIYQVKEKLNELEKGDTICLKHICPEDANKIVETISGEYFNCSEDWNGVDLDWSVVNNVKYDGNDIVHPYEIEIWGSAMGGSICFEKK